MADRIFRRTGSDIWQYRRRTPTDVAHIDSREIIRRSLKTDSQTEARRRAAAVDAELESYWDMIRRMGPNAEAAERHEAAVNLARRLGFTYVEAAGLSAAPTDDLLARAKAARENAPTAAAVMGAVAPPQVLLSGAAAWMRRHSRADDMSKSTEQLRRRYNSLDLAARQAVVAVGDKPLREWSHHDTAALRDWHVDKVLEGAHSADTANKMIGGVGRLWRAMEIAAGTPRHLIRSPFEGVRLKAGRQRSRPPYSAAFIRDRVLAPGALDGLNEDAQLTVLLMIETGARISEIVNLRDEDLVLKGPVAHLRIGRAPWRENKSDNAPRDIPLVGVSLWAARRWRRAPSRYRDKEASASAAINKYLRAHGLVETPGHSLYSLRHSFESRLRQSGAAERVLADLMGHAFHRAAYGAPDLKELRRALKRARVR